MALSVLPAHSLLLESKGYEAVALSAMGSYGAILFCFLLIFPNEIITKPKRALYFMNIKIRNYFLPIRNPIIIGAIDIEVDIPDELEVEKVEFYINDELQETDMDPPYSWTWKKGSFIKHRHKIETIIYDDIKRYQL